MWNTPDRARLRRIPGLYATEHIPLAEKLIYLHFFLGGCDWYIAEYDGQDLMWGFVILNGDHQNAEWGYISFSELKAIKIRFIEIDCELEGYWQVRPAYQIKKIQQLHPQWPHNHQPVQEANYVY